MEKTYVTVAEVLERLRISRSTLYNWEKSRVIPIPKRNRSGYRIYDMNDLKVLEAYAFKIQYPEEQPGLFDATSNKRQG